MTKCNWELACTLFLGLDCFEMNCIPFPVRNPSSATRRYSKHHRNDGALQSSKVTIKPIFPTSSDVFSNAWLDLFRPMANIISSWGVLGWIYESLRVWAGEVSDFHGGNFTQNWIRNWNSWCCSWSYSNSCKLSSCFHRSFHHGKWKPTK